MNILFVTSNRVGDAVLSTGLLSHLIAAYPEARITLACGPVAAPLFAATPNLERVIALRKRRWGLHWLELWRNVAAATWDLVVDLRASAVAWAVLAGERRVLKPSRSEVHRVRLLADLMGLDEAPAPKVWAAEHHRARARELVPGGGAVLGVGPTANWGGKQWPAARFAEVIARLTAVGAILEGAQVAVFAATGERAAAQPVIDSLPEACRIDLAGGVDLLTAFACLERCALYLGNDSGLMHLAAAAGTPTLGLFGPSKESLYAPWGAHTAVVRTELSYDDIVGAPGYDYRRHESHMDSLSVDRVEAAALALWRRARGEAG